MQVRIFKSDGYSSAESVIEWMREALAKPAFTPSDAVAMDAKYGLLRFVVALCSIQLLYLLRWQDHP